MSDEMLIQFPSRLPKDLLSKLKKRAERNVRSANSELIVALRFYLTGEKIDEVPNEKVEA